MNASYADSLRLGNVLGHESTACGSRRADVVDSGQRDVTRDSSHRAVSITMAAIAVSATVFGLIAASF